MSVSFESRKQTVSLIPIPDGERSDGSVQDGFSFRKLWAFTGPGFLLSVAYMDPGNIENDLQSGLKAKYKILWILLTSTVMALMMQRLSLRLGVVTGRHLAEMCHLQYPTLPRLFLWLMIEVAIIGSDMQEVIGTAIALYLLSNKMIPLWLGVVLTVWMGLLEPPLHKHAYGPSCAVCGVETASLTTPRCCRIPLWLGVVLTVIDTFMFLMIDRYGLRKLELFFAGLVTIMVLTFGYQFWIAKPDGLEIVKGLVYPWCEGCDSSVALQAIGIVGATITPHNLYLHSGMVKSRAVNRTKLAKIKEANLYFFLECIICLSISLTVNIIVVSIFAHGLHHKSNADVMNICLDSKVPFDNVFTNNTDLVELDLYKSGVFLGCQYGVAALYIWGVGVLAAGEGATMMGCYAGQLTMEGFLRLEWTRWKRVLFTRSIAILPTFMVAFFSTLPELSGLSDLLNAMFSVQIPFATLPLIAFTSNPRLMGQFVNGMAMKIVMVLVSLLVIVINVAFVASSTFSAAAGSLWLLLALGLYAFLYVAMCGYLVLHMFSNMTTSQNALSKILVKDSNWRNDAMDHWVKT